MCLYPLALFRCALHFLYEQILCVECCAVRLSIWVSFKLWPPTRHRSGHIIYKGPHIFTTSGARVKWREGSYKFVGVRGTVSPGHRSSFLMDDGTVLVSTLQLVELHTWIYPCVDSTRCSVATSWNPC